MRPIFLLLLVVLPAMAGEISFKHHVVDPTLPVNNRLQGDYGLTALADINRDGKLDFVVGGRQPRPERLYWYEYQAADKWVRHEIGTDYQSDVGLAALDADGDGWLDLVCSGVWYRNPGKDHVGGKWERIEFATKAAGAHDIVAADVNGDGRKDIVMMGDQRTKLNALCWFKIPTDPRKSWERHDVGPGIHGAISPAGVADIDGDGHIDIVRGDTWYQNKDGKGLTWVAHSNIPMGRKGPYGVCVRTAIVEMDGNGKKAVVMCDADIVECTMVILRTANGGQTWTKQELPRSFAYGSLHSLAVADFNGDGKPDIVSNEQEELLPPGRQNPRWILWENLGEGKFAERILVDMKLGGHELQAGDVDGDGDIDIVSKPWGCLPWNGAGGRMHVDYLENRTK